MDFHDLTNRQRQVLDLIVAGKTNKEIATILGITENTVEYHVVKRIYPLLGVHTRAAAGAVYQKLMAAALRKSGIERSRQNDTLSTSAGAECQRDQEMQNMSHELKHVSDGYTLKRVHQFAEAQLGPLPVRHSLEVYREQLAVAPTLMIYAEATGDVIGCVLARIEDDHVLVGPVAVDEAHRRRGIGQAMLDEVERQAKVLRQSTLILGATEDAEPFYLACGFKPHLFVQFPEASYLPQLRALNRKYDIVWEAQDGGWSRLMLRTPAIDKTLQHAYESQFPNCATQTVFIKEI